MTQATGPDDTPLRETKQQPSRARSGHEFGCCLVSLHFLCRILSGRPVNLIQHSKYFNYQYEIMLNHPLQSFCSTLKKYSKLTTSCKESQCPIHPPSWLNMVPSHGDNHASSSAPSAASAKAPKSGKSRINGMHAKGSMEVIFLTHTLNDDFEIKCFWPIMDWCYNLFLNLKYSKVVFSPPLPAPPPSPLKSQSQEATREGSLSRPRPSLPSPSGVVVGAATAASLVAPSMVGRLRAFLPW